MQCEEKDEFDALQKYITNRFPTVIPDREKHAAGYIQECQEAMREKMGKD